MIIQHAPTCLLSGNSLIPRARSANYCRHTCTERSPAGRHNTLGGNQGPKGVGFRRFRGDAPGRSLVDPHDPAVISCAHISPLMQVDAARAAWDGFRDTRDYLANG